MRLRLWPFAVAFVGLGLDQLTKSLAVHHLADGQPRELVGTFLQLRLIRNPGAAFSTGTSVTLLLSVVAIVAAFVVSWFLVVRAKNWLWQLGLGLLLAGILGNVVDRIFREPSVLRGHVVDFLELPNWPIFNLADCFISVAAAVIVLQAARGINLDGTSAKDDAGDDQAVTREQH